MRKIFTARATAKRVIKVLFIVWLISVFVIEGFILSEVGSAENVDVDYVIVLGAGLKEGELSLELQRRLDKGLEYLHVNPTSQVIVSGGQGANEKISEAYAMKRYLLAQGMGEERIITEDKSTSTYENFVYTKEVLKEFEDKNEIKILIITSEFHMFRAKFLARRVGFIPYGISSDSVFYLKPYFYSREYLAVIKSLLLDR